ncbi:hypothetical protein [Psychromicrobium sp. YIM B11713]|uniref:AAA family ATPase n=1 Tax=Psychromicrobium sp. YIM B11713 TaxID=3145233 RepID=UPI00374F2C68
MKPGTPATRTEGLGNQVILVNGMSAAGKTTLARALASELRLPVFSKDDFKEAFYDFGPHHP